MPGRAPRRRSRARRAPAGRASGPAWSVIVDRPQLVPGELVGPGAVAEDRLFAERLRARLPRTGCGRGWRLRLRLAGGVPPRSALENLSQAVPPKIDPDDHERRRRRRSPIPPRTRRSREIASARCVTGGPSRARRRRSAQKSEQGDRDPEQQDRARLQPLADDRREVEVVREFGVGVGREDRGHRQDGGDQQRRQVPEAVAGEDDQGPGGDDQGEDAAARVGEVEGEQDRRAGRRPRTSAAPATSERRLIQRQQRGGEGEDDRVGVPVAERVLEPGAVALRRRRGRRRGGGGGVARAEDRHQDQRDCDPFTETLAPLVGLGQEERGKEDPEVHQDAVGLGDAQLDRTGPER